MTYTCLHCGVPFTPARAYHITYPYCSKPECKRAKKTSREKDRRQRRAIELLPKIACVECGDLFSHKPGSKQRICSEACRKKRQARHTAEAQKRTAEIPGHPVYTRTPTDNRKWPCRKCKRMSDNRLYCPECREGMLRGYVDVAECYGGMS